MSFVQTKRKPPKSSVVTTRFNLTRGFTPLKQVSKDPRLQLNNRYQIVQSQSIRSRPILSKLDTVHVHDSYEEEEADRTAEKIIESSALMHLANSADKKARRKCSSCEDEKEDLLSGKSFNMTSSEISEGAIEASNSFYGGSPLDTSIRAFMERRFGHNFSKVRVHTDDRAARLAHALNAHAFTVGDNIMFAAGQYSPHTRQGQRLLAHELTHVVQQTVNTNHKNQPMIQLDRRKVAIPSPQEAALRFLAIERLRTILRRHEIIQGRMGLQLSGALREEMLALMSAKDIDRLDFSSSRSVNDIINQVRRLRISLSLGPETTAERAERIVVTPISTVVPPSTPSILPEWLSLYDAGMVGFHVSIPSTPEPPLEARLTAIFRESGIPLDSRLLRTIMTNYNLGVQELEQFLRNLLPSEFRNQAPSLAMSLAEKLQTASLEAVLKRERPTPTQEAEQKGELTSIETEKKEDVSIVGSLKDKIKEIPAGVSITIRFWRSRPKK